MLYIPIFVCQHCLRWFLARVFSFFFYPEERGDTFLLNVGLHNIYTAPHPRRRHSSSLSSLLNTQWSWDTKWKEYFWTVMEKEQANENKQTDCNYMCRGDAPKIGRSLNRKRCLCCSSKSRSNFEEYISIKIF
jgi:hypothetical protein